MSKLLCAILIFLAPSVSASVPPMINYQGKLMQHSGAPVPDNIYTLQFAIYDVPTDGTALWSETNTSVQVKGGLFAVLLGSVNNLPSNIFDGSDRWFAVKVGDDPEMTPRQKIASVAYAYMAETVPDSSITTEKLAPGVMPSISGSLLSGFSGERRPEPYVVPAAAMVAFRYDDAFDGIVTPMANLGVSPAHGGNYTPLEYAATRGVVGTIAPLVKYLDGSATDNSRLTVAELHKCHRGGFAVASHSWDHGDTGQPDTHAKVIKEVVYSANYLRTLSGGNGTWPLGDDVRGLVIPGGWNGAPYDLNTPEKWDSDLGRTIRATYDWCGDYLGINGTNQWPYDSTMGMTVQTRYGHIYKLAIPNTITNAQIDMLLRGMATPGTRTVLYFHQLVNSGASSALENNIATWKRLIDAVAPGGAYYNKLIPVTLDALHVAYMTLPVPVGNVWREPWCGGMPGGDFEFYGGGALDVSSQHYQGFNVSGNAVGDVVEVVEGGSIDHGWPNDRYLHCYHTNSSANGTTLTWRRGLAPGQYRLLFDVKKSEVAGYTQAGQYRVYVEHLPANLNIGAGEYISPMAGFNNMLGAPSYYELAPDSWTERAISIGVPNWAVGTVIGVHCRRSDAPGQKRGICLDNVRLMYVGR